MKKFLKTCFRYLARLVRQIFIGDKTEIPDGGIHIHIHNENVINECQEKEKNHEGAEKVDDSTVNTNKSKALVQEID